MLRKLLTVRVLVPLAVLAVIVVAGWFWYRSSSLVKIKTVTVTGLSGPDVNQIRTALEQEAQTMTTLNLNVTKLERAVAAYPVVSAVTATTHGSHAVTINVIEKIPVATVSGRTVDGGGFVLPRATVKQSLPALTPVGGLGGSVISDGQVTGAENLAVLKVLGAAPYAFLAHVKSATYTRADGVVVHVRRGLELQFGGAGQAAEKWEAALAVLGSASSAGACEINVVDPQRPASGTSGCGARATAGTSAGSSTTPSVFQQGTQGATSTTPTPTATTPTATATTPVTGATTPTTP